MMIEELEHARARGAHIYAEVVGGGSANDAHDMAQPDGDGLGLKVAVEQALKRVADRPARGPAYIFDPRDPGTRLGDQVETTAIKQIFGAAGV